MSTTPVDPAPAGPGAARPAVAVTAATVPVLSSALASAGVPVVARLALTNRGGVARAATVRLQVLDTEGPVGGAVERTVDLPAGRTTVLHDIGLFLDPAAMGRRTEQRPGSIEIDVLVDGADVGGTALPVQVLATGQWLPSPLPLAAELLAAHVRPHDSALEPLLEEAEVLLAERTGDRSVRAVGRRPERIDAVVAAVADALTARDIRPGDPPADWAAAGQQIGTPADLLDGEPGTPLDAAVVLAAALERAGVRPLVWVLAGGDAVVGYWREPGSAGSAITPDVDAWDRAVQDGTAAVVGGWSAAERTRVVSGTDVHGARRHGIGPLPAHVLVDGVAEVVRYRPPASDRDLGPPQFARSRHGSPEAPARVAQWRSGLFELAEGHRLLGAEPGSIVPLELPGDALTVLQNVLTDGGPVRLIGPGDDGAAPPAVEELVERHRVRVDLPADEVAPALQSLADQARGLHRETGAAGLFLALGSLVWELDGQPLRAPLLLVPVALPDAEPHILTCADPDGVAVNLCLLEKLRQVHGLTVPELAEAEGVAVGIDAVLPAVARALAGAGLEYVVEPTAGLAVLPEGAYLAESDLDEHWAQLARNPLVGHLLRPAREEFLDPAPDTAGQVDLDELAASCPLPADASQLRVVAEARAGRTIVVDGPPGTGKSQTVANVVARTIADGGRVLVLARKPVALDDVADRLAAVGLGPAVLALHADDARAPAFRARVRSALAELPADSAIDGSDPLAEDELRAVRRTLARYALRLHAPDAAGLSYYSAHAALLGNDTPALPVPIPFPATTSAAELSEVRRALALLPEVADLTRPSPRHAWAFVDTAAVDLLAAQSTAAAVDHAMRRLPTDEPFASVLREVRTPADLDGLAHLLTGPNTGPDSAADPLPSLDVLDEVPTERWTTATAQLLGEVTAFAAAVHPGLDLATPDALALPLADLYVAAQTAQAGGALARRRGLVAVRDALAPALRPGVRLKLRDVPDLAADLWRLQTAATALATRASAIPGLVVPEGWNPLADPHLLDTQVAWLQRAGALADRATGFAVALRRYVVAGPGHDAAAAALVARLRDTLSALLAACATDADRLAEWCGEDGLLFRWAMTRPERGIEHTGLMSLRRWAVFLDTLEPLRVAGLTDARRALVRGETAAEVSPRAFEVGLARAALAERREASGLDDFDVRTHDAALERLGSASAAVRRRLATTLPAGLRARRAVLVENDALRFDALRRELDRARRGASVRAVLEESAGLVTALLPCVLATPDAVARFLPARGDLFDLVVVDEASLLPLPEAVGALGRARSAVVVGDLRPLPPLSFGVATGARPDAGADDAPAESLLAACVRGGVRRFGLAWHYRSADEFLAAAAEDGQTATFPPPTSGTAISLQRVPGTFHRTGSGHLRRTNPLEAKAVVAEVRRRVAEAARDALAPSIAVVALTAEQRVLVAQLLRSSGDPAVLAALDAGLIVATPETVQGQVRDVVLLSTVFSADDRGALPVDLGPLGRPGGEALLDVAVTRARSQVVVVTSLDAAQLHAETTVSAGVRRLRGYLDLAELGRDALPRSPSPRPVDPHREEIAAALRGRGLVVATDVGLSAFRLDLVVSRPADPQNPVLAVLLDGLDWARRSTVGDRDGLPAAVLTERMGWPAVRRVWLPAWLADPDAVLDMLVAAVPADDSSGPPSPAAAADRPPVRAVLAVVDDRPASPPPQTPGPAGSAQPGLEPADPLPARAQLAVVGPPVESGRRFIPWRPRPAGDRKQLDRLDDDATARAVRRLLEAGVKAEAPIHRDRLARLAAGAFGLSRVTPARRDQLLGLLPADTVHGDFVWPDAGSPAAYAGYRKQAASTERPLEHVAPEEIGNAMVAACPPDGLPTEQLLLRTGATFGYRRRTPSTLPALEAVLGDLLDRGRLLRQPDGSITSP